MRHVIGTQTAKYDSNSGNKKITTTETVLLFVISPAHIRWLSSPCVQQTLWTVTFTVKHSEVSCVVYVQNWKHVSILCSSTVDSSRAVLCLNEMNEWKCGDLKCVQKPTYRGRSGGSRGGSLGSDEPPPPPARCGGWKRCNCMVVSKYM